MKGKDSLHSYIDSLQANGTYWFMSVPTRKILKMSPSAFKMATHRLSKAHRIAPLGKGFNIIIPLEYKKLGALPPFWFIDDFMKQLEQSYYIGLLTAAAHHGATHQAIQQFQVITNKTMRLRKKNPASLVFFTKKNIQKTPIEKIKVYTGYVNISTKEATALDLVQYYKVSGHWGLVGTILSELSESLDSKLLADTARQGEYEIATLQRMGFILDHLGYQNKTGPLQDLLYADWTMKKTRKFVALTPEKPILYQSETNGKWRIKVNDTIEVDDI